MVAQVARAVALVPAGVLSPKAFLFSIEVDAGRSAVSFVQDTAVRAHALLPLSVRISSVAEPAKCGVDYARGVGERGLACLYIVVAAATVETLST